MRIKQEASNLLDMIEKVAPTQAAIKDTGKVSIREFVKSPDYLGLEDFWEEPLIELERLREEGCLGGVIEKGIGGGKSFTVSVLPLYDVYCLAYDEIILGEDPRQKFSLDPHMIIYAAVFTVTQDLAREIFRYMQSFALGCPWFQKYLPIDPRVSGKLHFLHPETKEVRYISYPGHSKISSSIGRSLISVILDECNFFMVTDSSKSSGKDYAEELYEQLEDRIRSRFGLSGSILVISSRNTVHDFSARLKRKLEMSENADRYFLPEPKTSWEGWPLKKKQEKKWRIFDKANLRWASKEMDFNTSERTEGFSVPDDFWNSFSVDPEKALKNLASIPSEALEPFFRKKVNIEPDWDKPIPLKATTKPEDWMLTDDYDSLVEDWVWGDKGEKYHMHVDLAKRWDGCGIVLSWNSGIDEVATQRGEARPEKTALIDSELMILIRAPKGDEIVFEKVRDIIYWLKDVRGFRIGVSSYDGWQSTDSIQILKRKGVPVEELSVDRNLEPYTTMKDALYEGRWFFYPAHGQTPETTYQELCRMADAGDASAVLQREMFQLEIVNGKKVDHPPNGSKDVADAACGSITQVTRRMRSFRGS